MNLLHIPLNMVFLCHSHPSSLGIQHVSFPEYRNHQNTPSIAPCATFLRRNFLCLVDLMFYVLGILAENLFFQYATVLIHDDFSFNSKHSVQQNLLLLKAMNVFNKGILLYTKVL